MIILVLAVGCLVFGLLLYLPFALWFRRQRRRGKTIGPEVRYTRSGVLFAFAMLATFAGGLAVRAVAPDSGFASWIGGDLGAIRWGIGVYIAFVVAEMVLLRADVALLQPPLPASAVAADAPTAAAGPRRAWTILTLRGVPVIVRGSLPLGGLLFAVFAGSGVAGTIAYCLSFIALIVVHELGHFVAARAQGLKVFAVIISGVGGSCLTQVPRGVRDTFVLFAGGLAAQALLGVLTLATVAFLGYPQSPAWQAVVATFTLVNLVIAAVNLVPGKIRADLSNDGAILWDLLLHVAGRKPHPLAAHHAASPVFGRETRLTTMEGMIPPGFEVGVEFLNDDGTPMEFVVEVLEKHLGLDHASAVEAMVRIHKLGGQLFSLADRTCAEDIARGVMQEARERGHPLLCRAVWTSAAKS